MKKTLNIAIIISAVLCLCITTGCTEEKRDVKKEKAEISCEYVTNYLPHSIAKVVSRATEGKKSFLIK